MRFITSKMLYSVEEIFAVEGFLINFAELFFAIQENEPNFAELILPLVIDAIERLYYNITLSKYLSSTSQIRQKRAIEIRSLL